MATSWHDLGKIMGRSPQDPRKVPSRSWQDHDHGQDNDNDNDVDNDNAKLEYVIVSLLALKVEAVGLSKRVPFISR